MTVKLLRDAKITHKAGDVVNVSPAEYNFLVSLGGAVPVPVKGGADAKAEVKAEPKKVRTRK